MTGSYLSSAIRYWRLAFGSFQIVNKSFDNERERRKEEKYEWCIGSHQPHFCWCFFLHRVIYFQLIHLFGKIKWNNKELTKFVEKETFKEMKRQERKLEKREREREREKWTTIKMRSTGPHSIWFFNLNITVSLLRLLKPSGNNRATPADWLPHHQPNPINIQMKPNDVESGYSNGPHWVRFGNLYRTLSGSRAQGFPVPTQMKPTSSGQLRGSAWNPDPNPNTWNTNIGQRPMPENSSAIISSRFFHPPPEGIPEGIGKHVAGIFENSRKESPKKKNATKKDHPRTAEIQTEVLRISKEQSGIAN